MRFELDGTSPNMDFYSIYNTFMPTYYACKEIFLVIVICEREFIGCI